MKTSFVNEAFPESCQQDEPFQAELLRHSKTTLPSSVTAVLQGCTEHQRRDWGKLKKLHKTLFLTKFSFLVSNCTLIRHMRSHSTEFKIYLALHELNLSSFSFSICSLLCFFLLKGHAVWKKKSMSQRCQKIRLIKVAYIVGISVPGHVGSSTVLVDIIILSSLLLEQRSRHSFQSESSCGHCSLLWPSTRDLETFLLFSDQLLAEVPSKKKSEWLLLILFSVFFYLFPSLSHREKVKLVQPRKW